MNQADPRQGFGFRRRVVLARAAAAFEALWLALWPVVGVLALFLVISLLGLWQWLPSWLHGLGLALFALALGAAAVRAWRALRWPDQRAALRRLERVNQLPHQPLRALGDRLEAGRHDPFTRRLWRHHQDRLGRLIGRLRVGLPRSPLPARDPFGLRAALLLLLIVAVVEAGGLAPERLVQAFAVGRGDGVADTPVELTLWITPPAYTGAPPRRLEPIPVEVDSEGVAVAQPAVALPAGSEALAQLHHLDGAAKDYGISLGEQAEPFVGVGAASAEASMIIGSSGDLRIGRPDEVLGVWRIEAVADAPPAIAFAEPPAATHRGVLRSRFLASDDYGLASVGLLLRREGSAEEQLELLRPPGATTELDDAAYVDLTPHPWAGLPVTLRLEAVDGLGQRGRSEPEEVVLPERPFRHPVARAIILLRRQLAADPKAREEVIAGLDQLGRRPDLYQDDKAVFLALRTAVQRLLQDRSPSAQSEVQELLWDTALYLEDGTLSLAERELRELQEALRDALAEGASDEELERLMAELERALNRYLDAMVEQARQQAENQEPMPIDPNAMQVQRQDLQQLLDQVREMIRTGAREAAEQMLAQLQELLENLQMAQSGQMQQGQQMLSDLQRMIQRQQELLDQTFGLSRQQGQQSFQDRPGERGQGGQEGQEQGQMGGMQPGGQPGQLATGQEALRRALGELMRALGEGGMPIPRALGEAELSMRSARDALQEGAAGEALDPQAQAVDRLRQGGQAMMQEMQQMYGQGQGQMPGQQFGQAPNSRDPLGRSLYNQGGADVWGTRVPSELDLGQARAILDELFRRASKRSRPADELDYLERLLRRF